MTTPTQSKIHPIATLGIMYQSHFLPFADMADFISLSLNTTSPKVLVIGAHPDDPETCCGGTIITLKNAGYDVVVVYMTRGQSGISGKSKEEAGAIRTQEALNACEIMGVRSIFMSQSHPQHPHQAATRTRS